MWVFNSPLNTAKQVEHFIVNGDIGDVRLAEGPMQQG